MTQTPLGGTVHTTVPHHTVVRLCITYVINDGPLESSLALYTPTQHTEWLHSEYQLFEFSEHQKEYFL